MEMKDLLLNQKEIKKNFMEMFSIVVGQKMLTQVKVMKIQMEDQFTVLIIHLK